MPQVQERYKKCPNCQNFVPESAAVCMYCNAPQAQVREKKKPSRLRQIFVGALVVFFSCIAITIVGSLFLDDTTEPSTGNSSPSGELAQSASIPTFTPTSGPTATPTETPIPTDTPTPVPTPTPVVVTGVGQQASAIFDLQPGLVLADLTHTGSNHFGVWLLDGGGNQVELLANNIGFFDGGKAFQVRNAGQYLLDVSADGNWTAQLRQPGSSIGANRAPQTFTGNGQQYSPPVFLDEGLHRFTLTHNGSGHFGVWLMDSSGNNIDLLANEIDSFSGSKALGIRQSGTYILDISADGDWTIVVE